MNDELEEHALKIGHRLADEHGCYSRSEILERLQEMVTFAKEHYEEATNLAA